MQQRNANERLPFPICRGNSERGEQKHWTLQNFIIVQRNLWFGGFSIQNKSWGLIPDLKRLPFYVRRSSSNHEDSLRRKKDQLPVTKLRVIIGGGWGHKMVFVEYWRKVLQNDYVRLIKFVFLIWGTCRIITLLRMTFWSMSVC